MSIPGIRSGPIGVYARRGKLRLDGSVRGIHYNRYRRGRSGLSHGYVSTTPYSTPNYHGHTPQGYDPAPGHAEFNGSDYEPYGWEMLHRETPPLRLDRPQAGQMSDHDEQIHYNDSLITDEWLNRFVATTF